MMKSEANSKQRRTVLPGSERLAGSLTALRPIEPADLPILQGWDNDPAIIELMGRKYEETAVEDWYQTIERNRTCRALAIETQEGRLIGELELAHLNWRKGTAELRICIGEKDCWGKGFGTDALSTAMRLAFDVYGLQAVYLRVFATNERAIRLYKQLGFRTEAVLAPSSRRQDPAAIHLMNLTRARWEVRRSRTA